MHEILVIGIFLSLFLSFVLLAKRMTTLSVIMNMILLLSIGVYLYCCYLFVEKGNFKAICFSSPLLLAYGQMVNMLIVSLVDQKKKFTIRDLCSFIPSVCMWICLVCIEDTPLEFVYKFVDGRIIYSKLEVASIFLFFIINASFSLMSYQFIETNSHLLKNDIVRLDWIKFIVLCFFVCSSMIFVYLIMQLCGFHGLKMHIYSVAGMFMVLAEVLCGITAIKDVGYCCEGLDNTYGTSDDIISDSKCQCASNDESEKVQKMNMYEKSGLKKEMAALKYYELQLLMSTKKPYLRPDLNLTDLSNEMKLSPHHLSQLINQFENRNFRDYVNLHRVHEFLLSLDSNDIDEKSIKELYIKAGFSSKSYFYDVFKKHIGITPMEFFVLRNNQKAGLLDEKK